MLAWFLVGWIGLVQSKVFHPHPQHYEKPFPDPAKFHSTGRRLSDGSLRYEADDGGYHFILDLAGYETQKKVLELDQETSLEALACEDDVMSMRWAHAVELHRGDVLTGSKEWGCSLGDVDEILVEVVEVLSAGAVTEVRVQSMTPFQVLPNMALKYSWFPSPRRMGSRDLSVDVGFPMRLDKNYDWDKEHAEEAIFYGPFNCSNCFARLGVTPQFEMKVEKGLPVDTTLTFEAETELMLQVEPNKDFQSFLGEPGWNRPKLKLVKLANKALEQINILDKLGVAIPLVGKAMGVSKFFRLKLKLHPTLHLEFLADVVSFTMDKPFVYRRRETATWELRWSMEKGFSTEIRRGMPREEQQMPTRIGAAMLFGFSPCFGLKLTISTGMISWFEACPEVRLGLEADLHLHSNKDAFLQPSQDPDREICVEDLVFRTDGNLDTSRDEPYIEACLAGMCKKTRYTYFGSVECPCGDGDCGRGGQTTYQWCYVTDSCQYSEYKKNWPLNSYYWARCVWPARFPKPLCFKVAGSWLKDQKLLLTAREADDYFDDTYAKPLEISLSSFVNDIDRRRSYEEDLELPVGTISKLSFRVTSTAERRRLQGQASGAIARQTSSCDDFSLKAELTAGMHYYSHGIFIPYTWKGKREKYTIMEPFEGTAGKANFDPLILYCRRPTASTSSTTMMETESSTAAAAPTTSTTSTTTRITQQGCACRTSDQASCGNSDNDAGGDWCFVKNETCQGSSWGYCMPVTTGGCTCKQSWTSSSGIQCSNYCCNIESSSYWCSSDNCLLGWGWCDGDFPKGSIQAPAGARQTEKGCPCKQSWDYLFRPCANFCCNPFGQQSQDWCYVIDPDCEGQDWGFCTSTTTPSTTQVTSTTLTRGTAVPGQTTVEGCPCQESWSWGDSTCTSYCCNPDNDVQDWCLVRDENCQGSIWGYCAGSSPSTTEPTATPDPAARFTRKGCPCAKNWTLSGHDPCGQYCCNPDGDAAAWCFVLDELCEGTSWGYCESGTSTSAPQHLRMTTRGCACQSTWSFMELECTQGCCNPDNDVGDWCYVADEECQESSWGYCDGESNPTTSTTSPEAFVPQALVTRLTQKGCSCRVYWEQPGQKPCAESCCNPDDDTNGVWCLVADETCQGAPWGYCAEASSVSSPPMLQRYTAEGCLCQDRWMYGSIPCLSSCCNPDQDVRDWCTVVDHSCQGANWGYCSTGLNGTNSSANSSAPSPSPRRFTDGGCACQRDWSYMGQRCATSCCNPDNDISEWCMVTDTLCEGSGWGYCMASSDSTSSLESSTSAAGAVPTTPGASPTSSDGGPTTSGAGPGTTSSPGTALVSGSLTMSLADCAGFIDTPGSDAAMARAVATVSSSEVSKVQVELRCARRLDVRELQQLEQLLVSYEIVVEDTPEVYQGLMTSLQEMTPESMTTVVQNSLAAENISADITVTSVEEPTTAGIDATTKELALLLRTSSHSCWRSMSLVLLLLLSFV